MQKMTNEEYGKYIRQKSPPSHLAVNMLKAFVSGGLLCALGQGILAAWRAAGLEEESAAAAASVSLVLIGALLTGLGLYDRLAKFAGAGTLVPITGFANSVVSPALEYRPEGLVTGTAVKMFTIAGPVIVYGVTASVVYGVLLVLFGGG